MKCLVFLVLKFHTEQLYKICLFRVILQILKGPGVLQWQEHLPLTNGTWVQLPAWEVCELGLQSLSNVGGFSPSAPFSSPNKNR